jgi:hypothetical protein
MLNLSISDREQTASTEAAPDRMVVASSGAVPVDRG